MVVQKCLFVECGLYAKHALWSYVISDRTNFRLIQWIHIGSKSLAEA